MTNVSKEEIKKAVEILKKAGVLNESEEKQEDDVVMVKGIAFSKEKFNALKGMKACCPVCFQEFNTQDNLLDHKKREHGAEEAETQELYFFASESGKVIPMEKRHAEEIGTERRNGLTYLGMWRGSDEAILSKSAEEIKQMNLPKPPLIKPKKRTYTFNG